jgi:hypothetical protein
MKMKIVLLALGAFYAAVGAATEPEDFLAAYAHQARQADANFKGFSAERGRAFYFGRHKIDNGSELSCASCHHADPRKGTIAHEGQFPCRACHITLHGPWDERSATKREIPALAPAANPDRFTRESNVESWFGWNCKLLLKRECTPVEKGDLITWLLTIK